MIGPSAVPAFPQPLDCEYGCPKCQQIWIRIFKLPPDEVECPNCSVPAKFLSAGLAPGDATEG